MKKQRGFTLIELMIVVAIVAIIAAIAYPSYQLQILRARRADAHSSLMDISARLERFMAQNNTYTMEISAANGLGLGRTTSTEGFYTITIGLNTACGDNICPYVITATAMGAQAQDQGCNAITLSSTGVRGSNPADGATTPARGCW